MPTREALKAKFDEIDADGGGSLDRSEIAKLAVGMGTPLSEHELDAAMVEIDKDGSGAVSFDELVDWFSQRPDAVQLKSLLDQKVPSNVAGCERELVKLLKAGRDDALAAVDFVPLDDVALGLPHRRRRALITAARDTARVLQPSAHAFRSQAERGLMWSAAMEPAVQGRVLDLIEPLCKAEQSDCACCVYDRVISRRYKPEPGVPGLGLRFCLCKSRTQAAQREEASSPAARALVARMFNEIDADGSGGLDREEIGSLASRLGAPMSDEELDEAMATMDADGEGDVDLEEFSAWFRTAATEASWAGALLQCQHCAEYGLGFNCGGWTEEGQTYTAWKPKGEKQKEADTSAALMEQRRHVLRGYTRDGTESGRCTPCDRPRRRKKGVASRYRSPSTRGLRDECASTILPGPSARPSTWPVTDLCLLCGRYPSRYVTSAGGWRVQKFGEPSSKRRLEDYAAAAARRASHSPPRGKLSPEQLRLSTRCTVSGGPARAGVGGVGEAGDPFPPIAAQGSFGSEGQQQQQQPFPAAAFAGRSEHPAACAHKTLRPSTLHNTVLH